jgi:uncharacterized membrane protein YbhN (UPF0104 family)
MVGRWGRRIALLLLLMATGVGLHRIGWEGFQRAWQSSGDYGLTLGVVIALAALDVVFSGVVWCAVYRRLGVLLSLRSVFWVYLAGYAGLLVPAQLGRLIRPDAMARLSERPLSVCLRAEAAALLMNLIAVSGLLVGLIVYALLPVAALAVSAVSVGVALYLADRLSGVLVAHWDQPERFWCTGTSIALVAVQMIAWTAHGLGLHVVLSQSMPGVPAWEPVLHATLAALGGAVSGVPGGIGVTEWLLGGSLTLLRLPEEELVVSVAVFRAGSQWIWLPIGWVALAALRRLSVEAGRAPEMLARGHSVV